MLKESQQINNKAEIIIKPLNKQILDNLRSNKT